MSNSRDDRSLLVGANEGPKSNVMQQCVRAHGLLFTAGHTSMTLGKVGESLTTAQGNHAAREAALRLVHSVREFNGTLEGLSLVQITVCINSSPGFTRHGDVADGASEVLRDIFGVQDLPTRKALGMSSLPRGVAVEIDVVLAETESIS